MSTTLIQKKPKIDTRDKLLDVAEQLFARNGLENVSIKDITDSAKTRLASINYYFETKENLFNEVILRRAHILATERLKALDEIHYSDRDTRDVISNVVEAFVHPLLKKSVNGGPGWKSYCQLIARTATYSFSFTTNELKSEFNSVALRFVESLGRALPSLNNKQAHYAFHFMLSSTLYIFTENERIDGMSGGQYKSSDLESISTEMIQYIVGGLLDMESRGQPKEP